MNNTIESSSSTLNNSGSENPAISNPLANPLDNHKLAGLLNTASTDKQLRSRVKLFGNLLGNVLLSNAGAKVYDAVEKLRFGFIDLHREEDEQKSA